MEVSALETNIASAVAGVAMGVLGMFGTMKSASRNAQAVEFGALTKRLSEVEARADLMGETIYKKDRQLIAALEDASEAKAAAERAEERMCAAENRADELEERCLKLEHAFDELLKRTRMPSAERERLRALYRSGALIFSTLEQTTKTQGATAAGTTALVVMKGIDL
jgi:Fic family protein